MVKDFKYAILVKVEVPSHEITGAEAKEKNLPAPYRRKVTEIVARLESEAFQDGYYLALALGGSTEKMRFGHRGGNQPVKNLLTGVVEISSHNHGFVVSQDSHLGGAEVTHINLNDNTIEGIRHRELGAFSVQFHPEASPGPHDSLYLFDEFVKLVMTRQS